VQTGAGAVANILDPSPGSSLAVFGLGGVGMAGAALGVEQIIGVDLTESRRDTAVKVGATHVLDGADPGLVDKLRDLTGGGATHALDTTAVPAVVRTAAEALAVRGTLVVVGVGPDATFNIGDLIGGGKTVRGCIEGDANPQTFIPRLLDWQPAGPAADGRDRPDLRLHGDESGGNRRRHQARARFRGLIDPLDLLAAGSSLARRPHHLLRTRLSVAPNLVRGNRR